LAKEEEQQDHLRLTKGSTFPSSRGRTYRKSHFSREASPKTPQPSSSDYLSVEGHTSSGQLAKTPDKPSFSIFRRSIRHSTESNFETVATQVMKEMEQLSNIRFISHDNTPEKDPLADLPYRHLLYGRGTSYSKKDFLAYLSKTKKGLLYGLLSIKQPSEEKIKERALILGPQKGTQFI